jgi:basic membrane protein A
MRKRLLLLIGVLAAFSLVAASCGDDDETATDDETTVEETDETDDTDDATETTEGDDTDTTEAAAEGGGGAIGLVYDIGGRGDQSFNDSAAAGLDRAVTELGIEAAEASANDDGSNREELLNLQAESNDLVFGIGFLFAEPMTNAATANTGVNFAIVDDASVELDNVAGLTFAEEQGSFLVGAAAALKSESGTIGFIGGVNIELIQKFEAGFFAGAQAVNPDIVIE